MSNRDEELQPQYASDLHRQGEVETAVKPPHKTRKWIGNTIGLTFVGAVVGAAIIGVMRLANDPATAVVTAETLKQSIAPTPTADGELNGLNVYLAYPGAFNQIAQVKTDTSALEQYNLSSSASYRREITVNVKTLPSGKPNDDAGYRLREIQNTTYAPTTLTINGETVSVMKKDDGTEETFYWPHGGKLLIVSITSTEPGDHVDKFMMAILPTVKWK